MFRIIFDIARVKKLFGKCLTWMDNDANICKWQLVDCNDLGIPYFVKVKNNKPQKKQYVFSISESKEILMELGYYDE